MFGTGDGFTADEINAGTLNAGQIQILGTDQFYWDADNIYIYDTVSPQNQIRIGRYDGVNYGIGFTTDGGGTWQSAIGFDGGHLGSAGIEEVLDLFGYRVEVVATSDVLSNDVLSTTLSAQMYRGGDIVPLSNFLDSKFNWRRVSSNTSSDVIWNNSHKGVKSITVGVADVDYSATYYCDFID